MMNDKENSGAHLPDLIDDQEMAYQQCHALLSDGKVDASIACLENIVREYPDFAVAFNDLGVLYYQRGDKERSVRYYERAVSIAPGNASFRKNLADFYLIEQGRMDAAMELYLSVLNDNPQDIDVLMVAGHICTALNKNKSARTFYERVLDLEPWNFDANERMEQLNSEPSQQ